MINFIRNIFSPPTFDGDDEKSRIAVYLNVLLFASIILLTGVRISEYLSTPEARTENFITNPITILIGVMALLLFVMRMGFVREASFTLLIATWAALSFQARNSGGVYDAAFIGTVVVVLLAGLLLGSRASLFFTVLAILTGWGLAYFQIDNTFTAKIDVPLNVARDSTVIFILVSLISYLTISGLRSALKHSNANETELLKSNQQLQALRASLEKRVEERTFELQKRSDELEAISVNSEKRALQLQAVAQVGRAITSIQSLESLLPRVTGVIGKQFTLYHVGIFLLDQSREFAILSATNSPGGQRMLERSYRLSVGNAGIVEYAARTGQARIALNTGADVENFNNPDLSDTLSELAIPLQIGGEIIGVLDLQSEKPAAFGTQDIELLTIVADQVAIAIQNARRFQQTQAANLETETLYGESVRKQWVAYAKERDNAGYRFSGTTITPLKEKIDNPNARVAIQIKAPSFSHDTTGSKLAVPIQIRGQVIGLLNIEYPGKRDWEQDEIDITRSIAERVSLAIENARLLQDAQSRATKERVIGDIASKLSASNNMENIFQTAAQELGLVMPDAEVVVQFLPESINDDQQ